jgi:hypothetical protein
MLEEHNLKIGYVVYEAEFLFVNEKRVVCGKFNVRYQIFTDFGIER